MNFIYAIPMFPEINFYCVFSFGWVIVGLVSAIAAIHNPHKCVVSNNWLVTFTDIMILYFGGDLISFDVYPFQCVCAHIFIIIVHVLQFWS